MADDFRSKSARTCSNCGNKLPDGKKRKRNAAGDLICDGCYKTAVKQANSVAPWERGEDLITVIAHDSGDGQSIYHCPFCGSGSVLGRGDGTVECEYCQNCFTVQVQPRYPAMPQTNPLTGEPLNMPGMPGSRGDATQDDASVLNGQPVDHPDDPSKLNGQDKPSDPKSGNPDNGAASGNPDKKDDKSGGGKPPWLKGGAYITAAGNVLDEDQMIRHLAITHADDQSVVIPEVRASVVREAGDFLGLESDWKNGTAYIECPVCKHERRCIIPSDPSTEFYCPFDGNRMVPSADQTFRGAPNSRTAYQTGDRKTCAGCGKPISYHSGSGKWNHVSTEDAEKCDLPAHQRHWDKTAAYFDDVYGADHEQRIEALKPFTEYGPNYVRMVAENLGNVRLFTQRGEMDSAERYLLKAEMQAGLMTFEQYQEKVADLDRTTSGTMFGWNSNVFGSVKTAADAQTTLNQIGRMTLMSIGARNIVDLGNGGVLMQVGGGNPVRKVRITLNTRDLYDVEFLRRGRDIASDWTTELSETDLYNDQLGEALIRGLDQVT